ncbi:MAG TPA: cytochrome c family protein [Rhizomicrobium sp.]|jgi:cytochrome c|nr:cytochrome c family protein [Rhizomicrobium sp.]
MDSFESNKIIGAVLGTLLFIVGVSVASDLIFLVPMPVKPGYIVQGVPAASLTTTPAQPVEEPLPDFGTVLPKADVAKGKDISTKCEQCHDLSKGGPDKIGPNLWGIVDRPRASRSSYNYSSAMSSSHVPWTYANLFRYLRSPQEIVPGTKMTFAGLPSAQDRINLISYLRTLSDSPVPIPPPAPAATAKTPAAGKTAPAAAGGKPAAPAKPG